MTTFLSLVVPIFNEEDTIAAFYSELATHSLSTLYDLEVIFINDGSSDASSLIIESLCADDPRVKLIEFSRNFGKEYALMAGLEHSSGKVVVPIDVDLQDPLDVVLEFVDRYKEGNEVVLGRRVDRSEDSFLKRFFAFGFYGLINKLSDTPIENNVGDFRLLSRPVVDEIVRLPERRLFMKGVLSWPGFKSCDVHYIRPKRQLGKTKFNTWKLWNLALEGFTSFSTVPLRIWTYLGLAFSVMAFLWAFVLIFEKVVYGNDVPGYPSLMVAVLFFGGVQLIGIGVLGEYVGRIYLESKGRPRYVVRRTMGLSRQKPT